MATDFFQRQSNAQRSTGWLIAMFALSVIAVVATSTVVAYLVVQTQSLQGEQSLQQKQMQWMVPLLAGGVTLLIVLAGSAYKILELRWGGGNRVAESLGGRRIYPNTQDPVERRLMNVVEEMAIASGTPVPPVFMLDEKGINAFAAGYSPSDAVLGITRGCAESLNREQLQGVIAHEFSHILNGDMRMSIRLIGILHGILLLGLAGQMIVRILFYSDAGRSRRSSDDNKGGQVVLIMIALGFALIVLGYIGTFLGSLIKAAVSRQREFLADASAVQFTRNPEGIAGALKRIGAASGSRLRRMDSPSADRATGSLLKTAGAAEASHMYFAQGVWEGFSGLLATHPPLSQRIRAIEPSWDGKFPVVAVAHEAVSSNLASLFAGEGVAVDTGGEVPVAIVDHAIEHVGAPNTEHHHYATQIVASFPAAILDATHEPYSARAIVYALLLDHDPTVRERQMLVLREHAKPDVVHELLKLSPEIDHLDARARLPLIEMSLPALKSMSSSQYGEFRKCFVELSQADQKLDLFEWMLSQVLLRHLAPQFRRVESPRVHYFGLQKLGTECSTLLSFVAFAGNNESIAEKAFQAGVSHFPELKLTMVPKGEQKLAKLQTVLQKLALVSPKHRGRIVDACAAAICVDDHVQWQEAELLRGISDLLNCPMPPLLVRNAAKNS